MKTPLPICTLSALAACALSGQGGSRVYGEIKARDLCVTAPIRRQQGLRRNQSPRPLRYRSYKAAAGFTAKSKPETFALPLLQGGSRVYGEIKARDLCVTAPIRRQQGLRRNQSPRPLRYRSYPAFCFLSCLLSLSQAFLQARLHVGKHCTLSAFFSCCGWWFRLALYALH